MFQFVVLAPGFLYVVAVGRICRRGVASVEKENMNYLVRQLIPGLVLLFVARWLATLHELVLCFCMRM